MIELINIMILAFGFVMLIYGANLLVDSASSLAKRLKIPPIAIGLTVVAFGTSTPELVINVVAALRGAADITLGNVIGSNIFNVLVILGIAAIATPLPVKSKTTWVEIPLSFLAAAVSIILVGEQLLEGKTQSELSLTDGLILLSFFSIFLGYIVSLLKTDTTEGIDDAKTWSTGKSLLLLTLGLVGLVLGGRFIVDSATRLALIFGLSDRIIALTIVSMGTSLPELSTTLIAARKGNVDIGVGNVVGSNIFNIFFVLGISATLQTIPIQQTFYVDLMVNLTANLLLFGFVFLGTGRRVERWEGILFLAIYLAYLVGWVARS